jgi:tRNA pseudouridine55 synthase
MTYFSFDGLLRGTPYLHGNGTTLLVLSQDPLATGVLVIGVGKGTKELSKYLHNTKEYTATGMLGLCFL